MALSNLFGWKKSETDKPEGSNRPGDDCFERTGAERRQPAACGTACGAADKPEEKSAACGTACGASDK